VLDARDLAEKVLVRVAVQRRDGLTAAKPQVAQQWPEVRGGGGGREWREGAESVA
jgi:hypothetical protein